MMNWFNPFQLNQWTWLTPWSLADEGPTERWTGSKHSVPVSTYGASHPPKKKKKLQVKVTHWLAHQPNSSKAFLWKRNWVVRTPTFQFIKQVFVPDIINSYFLSSEIHKSWVSIYIYTIPGKNEMLMQSTSKWKCWQDWVLRKKVVLAKLGGGGWVGREQEQQFSTLSSDLFVLEQTTL